MFKKIKIIDDKLQQLVGNIEILNSVAPLNYAEQKKRFFDSSFRQNPDFVYPVNQLDVFRYKRKLYNLPVEDLEDDDLILLYSDIIHSYAEKISQLRAVGTPDFLYESLSYYGEPSVKDLRNAQFIMHLPDIDSVSQEKNINIEQLTERMTNFAVQQGYNFNIKVDDSLIANALVSGSTLKINPSVNISENEATALAHHELGVHLLTTLNARLQPIKALTFGLPVNTLTQEGLAILCEYLAGAMSIERFKVLALRVLAVDSLIKEKDFKKTFLLLKEQYKTEDNLAFTITARVYRGGGFTKDYLYLNGLHEMLNAHESEVNFENLLCGKTSHRYLPIITRLIEKEYLVPPHFISPAIANPQNPSEVERYIAHAIK